MPFILTTMQEGIKMFITLVVMIANNIFFLLAAFFVLFSMYFKIRSRKLVVIKKNYSEIHRNQKQDAERIQYK